MVDEVEATPAATVVVLRDTPDGLETLLLRRNVKTDFASGMLVFPGGRVDPEDLEGLDPGDELAAARVAAAREAQEEAALVLDAESFVPFAFWCPPAGVGRRFSTWFFACRASDGTVQVDGGEIVDHVWVSPAEALQRHAEGTFDLMPPTYVTLSQVAAHPDTDAFLEWARSIPELPRYVSTIVPVDGGMVAMWEGDAGHPTADPSVEGRRRRLWMVDKPWRYEEDR